MDGFRAMLRPMIWAFGVTVVLAFWAGARATGPEPMLVLSRGPGNVEQLELGQEDLLKLEQVTIATENEFTDGKVLYKGPLVRDVIALLTLDQAEFLRFTAANDYFIDIPTEDFRKFDAILAMEADGVPLSRRDKGPIWLMYPISDHDELRDRVYTQRLIWQLVKIESL